MNNIITFDKYKELVRLYESQKINEGIISNLKEKFSTKHVDKVLGEEIELGKQVEEKIKDTIAKLHDICGKLKETDDGSDFKKQLEKILDEIDNTSFDTLNLLGDANIDFIGFRKSAIMANVVNISVLLSPIKNTLMLRRAYKYFIGLIKQSLRRDIVMLLLNFDQFQNDILLQSLETEDSVSRRSDIEAARSEMETLYTQAASEILKKRNQTKTMNAIMQVFKMKKDEIDVVKKSRENNSVYDFIRNGLNNNTYKQSAETLKQLIGEDNQKLLDSHKNSITKIASTDKDGKLGIYGDLLISIAEEKALKTSIEIHTNFLKLVEVFKLSNQKKLVEMMQEAEKEYKSEIEKKEIERKKKEKKEFDEKYSKFILSKGKELINDIHSFDDFRHMTVEVECPNGLKLSKKELLKRYLSDKDSIDDLKTHPYLKTIYPFDKYDKDYKLCYLYYIDILIDKVSKCFYNKVKNEYYFNLNNIKDVKSINKIKSAFLSFGKINKNAKNALNYISDEVYEFDYKMLLDKILNSAKSKTGVDVEINEKSYDEFKKMFEYLKEYKDNDYNEPEKEKK